MNDFIKWDSSCRVGVEEFDTAHRRLFEIGNRLIQTVLDRQAAIHIQAAIDEFVGSMQEHFEREEEVLRQASYPDCEAHSEQHRRLLDDFTVFKDEYFSQTFDLAKIVIHMTEMIKNHVQETDMHYARFLNDKGIR